MVKERYGFRCGEKVIYEGEEEIIIRIDGHVHPFVLKDIGRVERRKVHKLPEEKIKRDKFLEKCHNE